MEQKWTCVLRRPKKGSRQIYIFQFSEAPLILYQKIKEKIHCKCKTYADKCLPVGPFFGNVSYSSSEHSYCNQVGENHRDNVNLVCWPDIDDVLAIFSTFCDDCIKIKGNLMFYLFSFSVKTFRWLSHIPSFSVETFHWLEHIPT